MTSSWKVSILPSTFGPHRRPASHLVKFHRLAAILVVAWTWVGLSPTVAASSIATDASPSPSLATIRLSADSAAPGAHLGITGSGFPPSQVVALYIDNPATHLDVPGPQTDSHGAFERVVNIPNATAGPHQICAAATSQGDPVCAPLTIVRAAPSASPQSSAPLSPPISPLLLIAFGVIFALALIAVFWARRAD